MWRPTLSDGTVQVHINHVLTRLVIRRAAVSAVHHHSILPLRIDPFNLRRRSVGLQVIITQVYSRTLTTQNALMYVGTGVYSSHG